jgi:5-methylcytosine-specific restriction enzyme A
MKFTKGNLALLEHLQNGKRVFLFESVSKGFVKFICEVEVFDFGYYETMDTTGAIRLGIKFFFKKVGAEIPLYQGQTTTVSLTEDPKTQLELNTPGITERKGLVTSRVGQGAYRKSIINRWEYRCAVTGFDKLDVLIASHIVPWAGSTDDERLDVDNGILLSPTYDALFDRNLITFENSGKIILSDAIEFSAYKKLGVTGTEMIKNLSQNNFNYLERHRVVFEKQH